MKIMLCLFLSHAVTLIACQPTASPGQPMIEVQQSSSTLVKGSHGWQPATFRDLTMGKSTRTDMLRVLGEPIDEGSFAEDKHSGKSYVYKVEGEIPGDLVVIVDDPDGVIANAGLSPRSLSKEQAIKYFGDDYEITRYDFDLCLGDGESAPLYESPNGNVTFIEYRSRGIAILANEDGKVDEIKYVSKPIGAQSPRCKVK